MPNPSTTVPLDVDTMRDAARRLLAPDAVPHGHAEVDTLTLQLRGHIFLLIPEIETAVHRLPEHDIPRACALACVGEARMRLVLEPGQTLPARIAHAQRLARSVRALCDHYDTLVSAAMCLGCDRPLAPGDETVPCDQVSPSQSQ